MKPANTIVNSDRSGPNDLKLSWFDHLNGL